VIDFSLSHSGGPDVLGVGKTFHFVLKSARALNKIK